MQPNNQLIFYPNAGFLGDKVVYEVLIRHAVETSSGLVVGMEWASDPLSMMDYPFPPAGVFVLRHHGATCGGDLAVMIEILDALRSQWKVSWYSTVHTIPSLGEHLHSTMSETFPPAPLWETLASFASKEHYPKLDWCGGTQMEGTGASQGKPVVTIHMRKQERDSEKNLETTKYLDIARRLRDECGLEVQMVGLGEEISSLDFDLPSEDAANHHAAGPISLRVLVQSLCRSEVHIGGDSGPTHLATALGRAVLTVEREQCDTMFGPYAPASQVIRLSREDSTAEGIAAKVMQLLLARRNNQHSNCHNPKLEIFSNTSRPPHAKFRSTRILDKPPSAGPLLFSSLASGLVLDKVLELYSGILRSHTAHAAYIPFRTFELSVALKCLGEMGVAGFSVSQPFKTEILNYVDQVSDVVRSIGAANTVYWNDGWQAENTDWLGASEALDQLWFATRHKEDEKVALLLGTGGAARAIAFALKHKGFCVIVVARREDQAKSLCEEMNLNDYLSLDQCPQNKSAKLFVNASSLGANEADSLNFFEALVPITVTSLFDVVISEHTTGLEQLARRRGCTISNGWNMLEKQAIHQIAFFCRNTLASS